MRTRSQTRAAEVPLRGRTISHRPGPAEWAKGGEQAQRQGAPFRGCGTAGSAMNNHASVPDPVLVDRGRAVRARHWLATARPRSEADSESGALRIQTAKSACKAHVW